MYTRLCAFIARTCLQLGVGGLVLLVCAVLYQVIGRYIFNDTPTWAESGAVLLVLYVTMLGMAVGVRDAGHIGLESFLVLAPDWLRVKLELLIHALVLLFGVVMAWNCRSSGRIGGSLQDPHAGHLQPSSTSHLPWPVCWWPCSRWSTSSPSCVAPRSGRLGTKPSSALHPHVPTKIPPSWR